MIEKILSTLKNHDDCLSGGEMSGMLAISRAEVYRHIHRLRRLGYDIRTVHSKGYKLESVPNVPSEYEVVPLLRTSSLGRRYAYFESIDSTSTFLASMQPAQAVHGTVVAADRQTAGRGRMQRTWHSPSGTNLYFSVLLRPDIFPARAPQLALVTAAAIIKVLKNKFPDLQPGVKWPNDILVQGRKLAGILCEMQAQMDTVNHIILGVGMNVNSRCNQYPAGLKDMAMSLFDATGKISNRQKMIADILKELETCYELWLNKGLPPFIEFLEQHSAIRDREITVLMQDREIRGIARGLSDEGYLLLETPDGILQLSSGEVHLKKNDDTKGTGA